MPAHGIGWGALGWRTGANQLRGCLAEGAAGVAMAPVGVGQGPHRERLCTAMPSVGTGVLLADAPVW